MCLRRLYFIRALLYSLYIYIYSQFSRLSFKSIKRSAADGDGWPVAFETAPGADNDEDRGQVQEFISAHGGQDDEDARRAVGGGGGMGLERRFNEPMGKISPAVPPD